MGVGKILGYAVGGAVLGVGAIAAAPFTGGGSILGAATLVSSLAGAGTIAAAAGTAAAVGGAAAYAAKKEDEEDNKKKEDLANLQKKAEKLEENLKKAIQQFKGDIEYFNFIIGATALGISMANANGVIVPEEIKEIEEFVGGIANSSYPLHVKETITNLYNEKPNFNTAMSYLERIDPLNYPSLRNLIELVALADGILHEKQKAFLKAFDNQIALIEYKPESNDLESIFLSEAKVNFN